MGQLVRVLVRVKVMVEELRDLQLVHLHSDSHKVSNILSSTVYLEYRTLRCTVLNIHCARSRDFERQPGQRKMLR